jgi:hypothetical protein
MEAAYEALGTEVEGVSPFDEPAFNGHDELQEIHMSSDSFPPWTQSQDDAAVQLDDGDDAPPVHAGQAQGGMPQFELLEDDHADGAVLATPSHTIFSHILHIES